MTLNFFSCKNTENHYFMVWYYLQYLRLPLFAGTVFHSLECVEKYQGATIQKCNIASSFIHECVKFFWSVFCPHLLSKCDPEKFTQFLFEICLLFVVEATSNAVIDIFCGAFGIFTLYSFYESSPLPKMVESTLQLIPMRLNHRDSPKYIYRRRFRKKIRLTRPIY